MESKTNRNFASFLDAFPAEDVDTDEEAEAELDAFVAAPSIAFDYLAVADELHSGRITLQPDRRKGSRDGADPYRAELAAYLEAAATRLERQPTARETVEKRAEPLPSIEPKDIAAELGLESAPAAEYARIRRRFAFANHPDRVAPHLRDRAMVRMQIANMLVDAACMRAGTNVKR